MGNNLIAKGKIGDLNLVFHKNGNFEFNENSLKLEFMYKFH